MVTVITMLLNRSARRTTYQRLHFNCARLPATRLSYLQDRGEQLIKCRPDSIPYDSQRYFSTTTTSLSLHGLPLDRQGLLLTALNGAPCVATT